MINIGICDSNKDTRRELCSFINTYFSSNSYSYNVFEFESAEALTVFFENKDNDNLDLLFTELGMQNLFIVLKKIRQNYEQLSIVINSTKSAYALKSFELWPLYYNIKPMLYSTLSKIMDRFIFINNNIREENVLIKNGNKFMNLSFNEISFIESQNTTIRIHMNNYEVLKTYGKLDDIEKQLSNSRFLRCHKSFLINMDYVKSVDSYKFTTIFGDTVAIKQREASKIKKKYYEYILNKEKYEK
jgi:DNA-binding LytR/AlgR family response regulator